MLLSSEPFLQLLNLLSNVIFKLLYKSKDTFLLLYDHEIYKQLLPSYVTLPESKYHTENVSNSTFVLIIRYMDDGCLSE